MPRQQADRLASRYARFAREEAQGRSPLYAAIATGVASDPATLAFLLSLPPDKQQPNLLLAAVRHVCGVAADWPAFRHHLLTHQDAVRAIMLQRSTQTNEPARCATLLPVLAGLPQPLALLEIGASAGLCLLPDCYGYIYGQTAIGPAAQHPEAPVFTCVANPATPLPQELPRVVWRAGLDLHPLAAADDGHRAWLETLVWPEQTRRLANLHAALALAARLKPRVLKGDLRGDALEQLCREAPADATLVCFHTAVLAYVTDPAERDAFARRVMSQRSMSRRPVWIANEAPQTFPEIARLASRRGMDGQFLLSVDGAPVAWSDPHGASIDWLG